MKFNYTSYHISWFRDRANEKVLMFKPPFQRNPVWLPKHKAYLIDTIIKGLPIPEVYLQYDSDEDGNTVYALVDGQQRIRTLLEFARGDVELLDEFSKGREGQRWDDLTKAEKKAFWSYKIQVREIIDASDPELRDLFTRLNKNTVSLNAQEIRNAKYSGDFIATCGQLADDAYWAKSGIVNAREIRRMLDVEFISELVIGLMHGPQNKKQSLDHYYSIYEDGIPEKSKVITEFECAKDNIRRMIPGISETRWVNKSDYYSLMLAVSKKYGRRDVDEIVLEKAGRTLVEFAAKVDKLLSKERVQSSDKMVQAYAIAVEKASSDKDRRVSRIDVIMGFL